MDDSFRQQIATFEHRLSHLLRDGFDLQRTLPVEPGAPELEAMRAWQRECAATISQLSGGSKQHWLSRAYSEAFLLTVPDSSASAQVTAGEAGVGTIVEGIIGVLRQAQSSLAEMRQSGVPNTDAPPARGSPIGARVHPGGYPARESFGGNYSWDQCQGCRVPLSMKRSRGTRTNAQHPLHGC